MKRSSFFVLFCLVGFSGCGTGTNPHISMEPPAYVEEMPSRVQGGGVGNPVVCLVKGIILYFQIEKL